MSGGGEEVVTQHQVLRWLEDSIQCKHNCK